ncbi:MAG: hypothetical protein FWD73_00165 [Polyangiaceae bacterium]|nr:hypothetical protein [Polyangiaceae bacterium]
MNRTYFGFAALVFSSAWLLWACGDDTVLNPVANGNDANETSNDAGNDGDLVEAGQGADDDAGDSASASSCVDTSGIAPRLLLTGGSTDSELAVFNLQTNEVEGHFPFAGFGATSSVSAPYLMDQSEDLVVRLDPNAPWNALSSWNVASDDSVAGGQDYADPSGVFVPTCTKGYVLRYNRNRIAVIDTTKTVSNGVPDSYIDLSSLVQPKDSDGVVDMTSAVFVPAKNLLYVLLGNVDLTKVAPDGYTIVCSESKPTIIAIDMTTDSLVDLGGTGPGGGIVLAGYNPPINGNAFVYDAALDRLIVMHAGCNIANDDGSPGDIQQRIIEGVDLATGQASTLLSLNNYGFPVMLAYADASRAAVGFYGQTFFWNPQSNTLGIEIPGGIDAFAFDGNNSIVGAQKNYDTDSIDIVRVPFPAAGDEDVVPIVETIGENPFTNNAGTYLSGAEVWPR